MKIRIFSLVLALVMLFTMATVAFAANIEIAEETKTEIVAPTSPGSVSYVGTKILKWIYNDTERARFTFKVWATWFPTCVRVDKTEKTMWISSGYGDYLWGSGLGGKTLCRASVLRDQHVYLYSAVLGDWHAYTSSLVNEDDVGDFNWYTYKKRMY